MTFTQRYASITLVAALSATSYSQSGVAGEYATARFTGTSGNRCAAFGRDFAAVEGSDACVRIGGRVRVQLGAAGGLFGGPGWPAAPSTRAATLRTDSAVAAVPSHVRVRGSLGYPDPFH